MIVLIRCYTLRQSAQLVVEPEHRDALLLMAGLVQHAVLFAGWSSGLQQTRLLREVCSQTRSYAVLLGLPYGGSLVHNMSTSSQKRM